MKVKSQETVPPYLFPVMWVFSYQQQRGQILSVLCHPGGSNVPFLLRTSFTQIFNRNPTAYFSKESFTASSCSQVHPRRIRLLRDHWQSCLLADFLLTPLLNVDSSVIHGKLATVLKVTALFVRQREKDEQEHITHWCSREAWFSGRSRFTWFALGCKTSKNKKDIMRNLSASEMTWVSLFNPSAWHCAASVHCLRLSVQLLVENDSPILLLVQHVHLGLEVL